LEKEEMMEALIRSLLIGARDKAAPGDTTKAPRLGIGLWLAKHQEIFGIGLIVAI
jgi:hypothetical protein